MIASLLRALRPLRKEDGLEVAMILILIVLVVGAVTVKLAFAGPGPKSSSSYAAQNTRTEQQACPESQVRSITVLTTQHELGAPLKYPIIDVVCVNGSVHQTTLTLRWH